MTTRLTHTISSQGRYDHFDTTAQTVCLLCHTFPAVARGKRRRMKKFLPGLPLLMSKSHLPYMNTSHFSIPL